jgi:hypothetical protein
MKFPSIAVTFLVFSQKRHPSVFLLTGTCLLFTRGTVRHLVISFIMLIGEVFCFWILLIDVERVSRYPAII